MGASHRHHYIPQLYLRGFTAANGKLAVYDKKYREFRKRDAVPKAIFFEEHRNTVTIKGVQTDIIERLYGRLETELGKFLEYFISDAEAEEIVSVEGIRLLKLFVAIQFWRLPSLDVVADQFVRNLDLDKYGNHITINGKTLGEVSRINELISTDSDFRYYFRCFFLPLIAFDTSVSRSELKHWAVYDVSPKSHDWDNFLCSDNPVVYESIQGLMQFTGIIVFPLCKTKLVVFSPYAEPRHNITPAFSSRLSMVAYSQADRYVAGANREYIEQVVKLTDGFNSLAGFEKLKCDLLADIK